MSLKCNAIRNLKNSANEMPNVTSEAASNAEEMPIFHPHVVFFSLKYDTLKYIETRFGPNRVAAHMREMENLIFWSFLRIFGEILEDF